ncbi:MAG TPA: carboxypeptidase-like regulatory domain-containing protein, partial [Vicinamibacterales bacterium]|nr:carboxypeptidase-like regulatory domain-containing protein [Vicinamibacterales bacterium]
MLTVLLAIALSPAVTSAQQAAQHRGVVVDQTGLPLPGAHLEVHRGDRVVASLDTGLDGGFEIPALEATDTLEVSLDGFETAHVPATTVQRIVLSIAHATETTEV